MAHMKMQTTQKGALYCADCDKCGTTMYSHEWASWDNNEIRDALRHGMAKCHDCFSGSADPETFRDCGKQYACRYSAPGYMDCTEWSFGRNLRELQKAVRGMYCDL